MDCDGYELLNELDGNRTTEMVADILHQISEEVLNGSERRFDKDVALCEVLNSGENGEKGFLESHGAKVGF